MIRFSEVAMLKFEIKRRNEAGQWKHLSISFFAGKTLHQVFLDLEGQEVVIEFLIDGKKCFFCGNQYWLERMQQKGAAVTFNDAINRLRDTRPDILQEKIPKADLIDEVFPGATVDRTEIL